MDSASTPLTMPLDIEAIQRILPHRQPFLLIDRVLEITETGVVAIKCVTANESFFQGHFPEKKVMPGVLQIEAMAQAGAVWALVKPELRGKIALLAQVKEAKFRRPVVPGDVLRIEGTKVSMRSRIGIMAVKTFVEGQLVCEAELMFAIAKEDAGA
jgi:3-hydroxyacyl-[acyl-carrier-protein] dehydratase